MTRSGSIPGWDYSWSSGTVHQCPARPHLWAQLYTWKLPAGKRNLSPFLHLIFSQKIVRLYTVMTSWHPEGCNALKHADPCSSSPLCKYISSDDKLLDQA